MQPGKTNPSPRRKFLGTIATGAAAFGLLSFKPPVPVSTSAFHSQINGSPDPMEADKWFDQVKGKHRIVFDCPHPNEIFPFAWPRVFLMTNGVSGSKESDCGVVVILRHDAICYAMEDRLWAKYNFGEVFKAKDPKTNKPSTRNPFWKPAPGDYKIPGIGEVMIGIDQLQASGVMFAVCDAAMTVFSAAVAEGMKMQASDVKKEWYSGLLPGIQAVPSGVWAVGRAQEHKCAYCYAG